MQISRLKSVVEKRGILSVLDIPNVPFTVRRMFWLTSVPAAGKRGGHSHEKCEQYYIVCKGSVTVEYRQGELALYKTLQQGDTLYVPAGTWTQETFDGPNAVLMVLCSELYDASDYITKKPGEV